MSSEHWEITIRIPKRRALDVSLGLVALCFIVVNDYSASLVDTEQYWSMFAIALAATFLARLTLPGWPMIGAFWGVVLAGLIAGKATDFAAFILVTGPTLGICIGALMEGIEKRRVSSTHLRHPTAH